MLPEAREVEGLVVDEEPLPVDAHRADADGHAVAVHHGATGPGLDRQVVEVPPAGSPQLGIDDPQLAGGPAPRLDGEPVCVSQRHGNGIDPVRLHRPVDEAVGSVDVGDDGDVGDAPPGRRVQPHAADQPGVVEEVLEVRLDPSAVGPLVDHARGDRRPRELVVDDDGEPHHLTGDDDVGQVGLEGQVSAFVGHDLGVVDPRRGPMGGGVEAQEDAPVPSGGDRRARAGTRRRPRGRGSARRPGRRCTPPVRPW